jgi:hypothetical protein
MVLPPLAGPAGVVVILVPLIVGESRNGQGRASFGDRPPLRRADYVDLRKEGQ